MFCLFTPAGTVMFRFSPKFSVFAEIDMGFILKRWATRSTKCFPTFDECRKPKIKGNITATYRPTWNEDYHRHASSITHWTLYTEFAILAKISADLRFLVLTLKSAKIDGKNPQSASFMRVKFANLDLKGSMMNFKTRCLYQSDLPSWDSLMHGFPMTHGVK